MSQRPRVDRMVMFKHGVAYLERRGPAEGAFELTFRRDEMNDVLKSLAVWVARGDAKVGAVAFDAPEDPRQILSARGLLLAEGKALRGLVEALQGRTVGVDDGTTIHRGEVLGIEETTGGQQGPVRRRLILRGGPGRVTLVDLASARAVELFEEPSREGLDFIVDRGRAATAGESRSVHVAISGRAEELRVAYVIPAPVWRVSYRLVREGGATTLIAMGVVHNPVDEDLEDVDLTLTTGQPVSFTIDLYHPKRVERAVVEEESRAAAAPTKFERSARAAAMVPAAAAAPQPRAAKMAKAVSYSDLPQASSAAASFGDSLGESADGASTGVDRGEFFEYRVTSKIALKRGGSAMVPLAAAKLDAKKERIWRDGTGLTPDLVLDFKNDSGVVLEEGPAVIYDEGVYAGESMVPYSARGTGVKLAFAKDLAVRCRRTSLTRSIASRVVLGERNVVEEQRQEEEHLVTAESDHGEEVEVIFELPLVPGRTLATAAPYTTPFEETASFRRFRATVPPHGKVALTVLEQWKASIYVNYQYLDAPRLVAWLEAHLLDQAAFDALSGVLRLRAEAGDLDAQREKAEASKEEAYAKQSKISEQLAVLKEGGPEGALRLRYVKELEAAADRVNACEAEIQRLSDAADEARKAADRELSRVTSSPA